MVRLSISAVGKMRAVGGRCGAEHWRVGDRAVASRGCCRYAAGRSGVVSAVAGASVSTTSSSLCLLFIQLFRNPLQMRMMGLDIRRALLLLSLLSSLFFFFPLSPFLRLLAFGGRSKSYRRGDVFAGRGPAGALCLRVIESKSSRGEGGRCRCAEASLRLATRFRTRSRTR